ncbi:synaptosomal-associated protein 47 isoform X1 [Canis lupus baileyi]|uniref:synaptosomal-associated protein 47 isoform X1 n=1 Tax=Canis lupus familiaris TaxID=9615 RepID=UPI0006B3DDE5|nr:synaptosomal-associated protein 47 isoform X1 [Canis lupus familiaris]XP_038294297.1 synaptosomal-associated protein 47 isoform X1 [Canis lupus familiaris]XP_038294304.1 synaptosomal-associated protein 47 isoform X1 [Canis lupus familiaris]XP_038294319.1 synaptosomal-associated protein 47 isoform X1 [Canis lupus familiaris]XP_038294324.1 synaptosomal-associated protein 47 isoform X1 [Canis lupus familiaris]XP_038412378.1 synaptosomal-associated protein 47 isoform X1 [Canis lupus familiaris]
MSREICVHSWPCSYYLEPEKRWVPGKLSLTSRSLRFMTDKTGETLVSFPLSSVVEIKKEASHFVFSSITILENSGLKHWFSSLQPSRNAVFSIIEHFWRELLLSPPEAALPVTKGKQLTGLMACSQKRLEETARVLHHQGEQLDSITRGLDKMESDLDMADRLGNFKDITFKFADSLFSLPTSAVESLWLLTELESPSWWPFSSKLWKMPAETNPKESTSMASPKVLGKEGVVVRIPAVISQGNASHVKAGSLTILVSGLEIHDSCSLLMHRFEREDIDDIKVHTPYEISIRQRFIGRPDIAYRLISAKMSEAIPILEVQFSKKMELLEDALMPRSARSSSPIEKGCSVWQAASGLMDRAMPHEPCSGSQEGPSLQLQRSEPLVSEGDAQELRQILRKLKSLALDTETELERQDDVLDGITAAIDRTTLTIDKHNQRTKKLT